MIIEGSLHMDEVAVGKLSDLPDGDHRIFSLDTIEVGIFRLGDRLVAYENVCPHAGGPVCQGKIFNRVEEVLTPDMKSKGLRFAKQRHVVCPWHGYEFDLETGCHPGDARVRLTPIPVDVRNGEIYLRLRG
jgi:nitrite reductase (NADH) small subunit